MRIPELEFPCDYPIRVICENDPEAPAEIGAVVKKYDGGFDSSSIDVQKSKNGNFISLRVTFTATGRSQLDSLHQALVATGRVKMVI